MSRVLIFSTLLLLGLLGSQVVPLFLNGYFSIYADIVRIFTMIGLSYIMIHVGYEFDIDKNNKKQYVWDYVVAFTAASFPWLFVTLYFVFVLIAPDFWGYIDTYKETLLAARFAAPTSAGVLFSMLAAAGLSATWLYRKARILAIFDDLDTVLLMIPLKMLMIGLAWQLGMVIIIMASLIAIAYTFLHRIRIPISWPYVLSYSIIITTISEVAYNASKLIDESVPIHIEVLLPAFSLGCMIAYPKTKNGKDAMHVTEYPTEKFVSLLVAASFMVFVGLSMPTIIKGAPNQISSQETEQSFRAAGSPIAEREALKIGQKSKIGWVTKAQSKSSWAMILIHVLFITLLSNLGKMFPLFCYRKEAHWRERLAVCIGMWPRAEVGAGVLVISLSYGIKGPIVTIAMLSLALNLMLTGVFIYFVKAIIKPLSVNEKESSPTPSA